MVLCRTADRSLGLFLRPPITLATGHQRAHQRHLRRWLPKSTNLNIGQIPLSIIEDNLNLMDDYTTGTADLYNQLKSIHR